MKTFHPSIMLALILAGTPCYADGDVTLPELPPFTYSDWTWGQSPERKLNTQTVDEIRRLLSKHLKHLPKPFSPYGPGGLKVSPERVIQIRDAKGADHAQILVLPGIIVYHGEYATQDKEVIARFLKILPPGEPTISNGRKMRRISLLMVLLAVGQTSYASQVFHQKLEAMISSVKVIAVGTVKKVDDVTGGCCPRLHHYTVEISETLVGEVRTNSLRATYIEQGSPHWSLILPSLGIEDRLKEGEQYLFLFQSAEEQGSLRVVITRAEPIGRREAVMKAWNDRDQKGKTVR